MRGDIKAVKKERTSGGFWEPEEAGTFIGNVIFVCLQLPPRSFVLAGLLLPRRRRRRASVVDSPKDCSSERLRFIANGKAFIADCPAAAWKHVSQPASPAPARGGEKVVCETRRALTRL